jgi:protease I
MKVAILVADGFEQVELLKPRKALDAAGADERGIARGEEGESLGRNRLGKKIDVDVPIIEARADDFEALLLPRGVINPDTLRNHPGGHRFHHRLCRCRHAGRLNLSRTLDLDRSRRCTWAAHDVLALA